MAGVGSNVEVLVGSLGSRPKCDTGIAAGAVEREIELDDAVLEGDVRQISRADQACAAHVLNDVAGVANPAVRFEVDGLGLGDAASGQPGTAAEQSGRQVAMYGDTLLHQLSPCVRPLSALARRWHEQETSEKHRQVSASHSEPIIPLFRIRVAIASGSQEIVPEFPL
jgi:hypothetical protein